MKKLVVLLVFTTFLLIGCGGAKEANNSNSKTSAPSNANSTNANSTAETKSDKVTLETVQIDEQIKPDPNAKLENAKKFPNTLFFDITLPAGWKLKKTNSVQTFTPSKVTADGLVCVYFMDNFMKESEYPVNDKRAMLEHALNLAKKDKDKGELQYFGTLGILSANQGVVIGVTAMRDKPAISAVPDRKCSADDPASCGSYSWTGYYGGEYHDEYYLAIIYPPGTYEKNKPVIDAIINSVHLH